MSGIGYYFLFGLGVWAGASARSLSNFDGTPPHRIILAFIGMIVIWPIGLIVMALDEVDHWDERSGKV